MARATKPGGINIVKPKHVKFASKWGRTPKPPGPPPAKITRFPLPKRGGKRGR